MRPIEPLSRLRLTRRQLLELLLPLAAWLPAPLLLAAASGDVAPGARSFAAFLDLLIPEDEVSPSASQAGVDAAILAAAQEDRQLARLVELGVGWLDAEARRDGAQAFHEIAEDRQLLVVSIAERQRRGSVPKVFFENMRHQAFGHYYANPRSWPGLGYAGPPQPEGFMDYQNPLGPGKAS
jgi:hypothetical protein